MKIKERQTIHLVDPSPWPIKISTILGILLLSVVILILNKTNNELIGGFSIIMEQKGIVKYSMLGVIIIFTLWIRDILRESIYNGNHTKKVKEGIMLGYMLFILSEIMIFITIFWLILNTSISPNYEVFGIWPPNGIVELEGLELPFNNTIILLGSGITITIAHSKIVTLNKNKTILYIVLTIFLSIWFILNQYIEYNEAKFTINDSIYGTSFYSGTGLHALHIIVGTIYITISLIGILKGEVLDKNNIRLESAIIYWHMVDIVWLILWLIVYKII